MTEELYCARAPDPLLVEFTYTRSATAEEAADRRLWTRRGAGLRLALSGCVIVAAIAVMVSVPRYAAEGSIAMFVAGSLFACFAWTWNNTVFCPDCGMVVSNSFSGRVSRWCDVCGRLMKPEELRSKNGRLKIDLEAMGSEVDPVFKCLKGCMLLCIDNRVDKLVFEPGEHDYQVYVRISEEKYELEPPPAELHPQIVAAAKSIWNVATNDTGVACPEIEVQTRRGSTRTVAMFSPSASGEVLSVSFKHEAHAQHRTCTEFSQRPNCRRSRQHP